MDTIISVYTLMKKLIYKLGAGLLKTKMVRFKM